jgi:hypothetical protein
VGRVTRIFVKEASLYICSLNKGVSSFVVSLCNTCGGEEFPRCLSTKNLKLVK